MTRTSTAFTSVDFDRPGKQVGFVNIPHSPHDDAWGVTRVPISIIANGDGPTVILEGGNHGDEYEGPIVIGGLIRELEPEAIQGRLILMPANNVHAAMAGRRTSPVDGLNMNRTYPGDPLGSITEQITAFMNDVVFPRADAFLTLHSGGSSLDLIPSAIVEPAAEPDLRRRIVAAVRAFDAPATVVAGDLGDPRTATATACRAGLVTVGAEMGGGGTVTPAALEVCRRGVQNVLAHLGVLPADRAEPPGGDGRLMELPGSDAFVYATADGIFEPFHEHGREVRAEARPRGASTAPGTRRGRPRPCTTTRTACSTAAASPAACTRATAAWSSPRRTRVSCDEGRCPPAKALMLSFVEARGRAARYGPRPSTSSG